METMGDRLFDESVYFSSSATAEGGEAKSGAADTDHVVSIVYMCCMCVCMHVCVYICVYGWMVYEHVMTKYAKAYIKRRGGEGEVDSRSQIEMRIKD